MKNIFWAIYGLDTLISNNYLFFINCSLLDFFLDTRYAYMGTNNSKCPPRMSVSASDARESSSDQEASQETHCQAVLAYLIRRSVTKA